MTELKELNTPISTSQAVAIVAIAALTNSQLDTDDSKLFQAESLSFNR